MCPAEFHMRKKNIYYDIAEGDSFNFIFLADTFTTGCLLTLSRNGTFHIFKYVNPVFTYLNIFVLFFQLNLQSHQCQVYSFRKNMEIAM